MHVSMLTFQFTKKSSQFEAKKNLSSLDNCALKSSAFEYHGTIKMIQIAQKMSKKAQVHYLFSLYWTNFPPFVSSP